MLRTREFAVRCANRLRWAVRRMKPALTRTVTICGTQITFRQFAGDTADQIAGGHEMEVYDYIAGLPAGSVFYDLGSSIGNFAIFAALRGLTAIAFEPDPTSFGSLLRNVAANKVDVRAHQIAISNGRDEHGILLTNSEKGRAGDHHKVLNLEKNAAHPGILAHLDKRVEVTTLSIDQAVKRMELPSPNYMKIDIDGSEIAFLEGAEATLSNPSLHGFIFELYKHSEYYPTIVETISRFGFEMKKEFQIYSGIPPMVEEGLFNIIFERSL